MIVVKLGHFCNISTNLHKVWDTDMIHIRLKNFNNDSGIYFQYLLKQLHTTYAQNISDWATCKTPDESTYLACSTAWIEEDAQIDCASAYIDENGNRLTPKTHFNMCDKYQNTRIPIVEQRILQGAVRLATVLNKIAQSSDENGTYRLNRCSH